MCHVFFVKAPIYLEAPIEQMFAQLGSNGNCSAGLGEVNDYLGPSRFANAGLDAGIYPKPREAYTMKPKPFENPSVGLRAKCSKAGAGYTPKTTSKRRSLRASEDRRS